MSLPTHKTKIVATIGLAAESPEMLRRLIRAGLNVAPAMHHFAQILRHRAVLHSLTIVF